MIRRSTWVILGIFVILLAGSLFWQQTKQKNDAALPTAAPVQPDQFLFDSSVGQISHIYMERVSDHAVVELRRVENVWQLVIPQVEATDSAKVESAVSSLQTAKIVASPSGATDLVVLGLEPPAYRLLVGLDNGKEVIINVGKAAGTGAGFYVVTSSRVVYVVNQFGLSGLIDMFDAPPVVPPTPTAEVLPIIEITPESPATVTP